jgi:hypothetical protein
MGIIVVAFTRVAIAEVDRADWRRNQPPNRHEAGGRDGFCAQPCRGNDTKRAKKNLGEALTHQDLGCKFSATIAKMRLRPFK